MPLSDCRWVKSVSSFSWLLIDGKKCHPRGHCHSWAGGCWWCEKVGWASHEGKSVSSLVPWPLLPHRHYAVPKWLLVTLFYYSNWNQTKRHYSCCLHLKHYEQEYIHTEVKNFSEDAIQIPINIILVFVNCNRKLDLNFYLYYGSQKPVSESKAVSLST